MSLGEGGNEARLAVSEGEVAIHHHGGEVKHLFTDEAARIDEMQLQTGNDPASEGGLDAKEPVVTLGTGGAGNVDHLHRSLSEEQAQPGISDGQN